MERQVGTPQFDFWLLGDSEPESWKDLLDTPLDPRHPTRHSIWTSVLDEVQDELFRNARLRMDSSQVYIRNAVANAAHKPPEKATSWIAEVQGEVISYRKLLRKHRPVIVCSFGSFAFEFARRALGEKYQFPYGDWSTVELGEEFRRRVSVFQPTRTNLFPLLHQSIARRHFLGGHRAYCAMRDTNYFHYTGHVIAGVLLISKDRLNVWIEANDAKPEKANTIQTL